MKDGEIARKEFGLEWMLRPEGKTDRTPTVNVEEQPKETPTEEVYFHLVKREFTFLVLLSWSYKLVHKVYIMWQISSCLFCLVWSEMAHEKL